MVTAQKSESCTSSENSIFSNGKNIRINFSSSYLKEWLIKYNKQDKFNFVSNLDIILRKADVISALDLVNKNAKIFRLIRESQDMDEESKKVLKEQKTR